MADQAEQAKKMGSVIARCWSDDAFKQKLLSDPAATLKSEGVVIDLPTGTSLKAVEDSDKLVHLVIPAKPTDLSDEDLDKVAGGTLTNCNYTATQPCSCKMMTQAQASKISG